jgi:hypothetical protein
MSEINTSNSPKIKINKVNICVGFQGNNCKRKYIAKSYRDYRCEKCKILQRRYIWRRASRRYRQKNKD